ncbi:hypothetical protein [Halocatena halophila]|uniref:hypothetical protein n=1 Tax=Halocatena halophila TaxID=2814576 RepID=UPI002ED02292
MEMVAFSEVDMADNNSQNGNERVPLTHRTDRIAIRNDTGTPFVFVDDDPLIGADGEFLRHQRYSLEIAESETFEGTIREIVDQFKVDSERQFYYAVTGDRAQICGNTIDDYFDALGNFSITYSDLDEQLPAPTDKVSQKRQDLPLEVTGVGVVTVGDVILQFYSTFLINQETRERQHIETWLCLTTYRRQGPLTAQWLHDRLQHSAIGSPSAVRRQSLDQLSLQLDGPLNKVKGHRLMGYVDEIDTPDPPNQGNGIEYITCLNPYYRADEERQSELSQQLGNSAAHDDLYSVIVNIDRIPMRPRGGSLGVDVDKFINADCRFLSFEALNGIVLASGKVDPIKR